MTDSQAVPTTSSKHDDIPEVVKSRPVFDSDFFYDAGDLGCAFGPLDDIAAFMGEMSSGQTLEIRATDPTVAVDLPAWCRLAGHQIITHQNDRYLVRRK
jgi:TusA-related sulfurtransferase